jgi:hypothetical protein
MDYREPETRMTVGELRAFIADLPADAGVFAPDGEGNLCPCEVARFDKCVHENQVPRETFLRSMLWFD